MKPIWIVIANASRARCFARPAKRSNIELLEEFEHPESRARDADLTHAGLGHGLGATTYAPRLDPKQKEQHRFAEQLAKHLNGAVAKHNCGQIILVASNPFLGEIKSRLNDQTTQALSSTVASDLTALEGRKLRERLDAALGLS